MNLEEVFEKVGKDKLNAAMASDDSDALKNLLEEEGIELSDEQLDYIAGGLSDPEEELFTCDGIVVTCDPLAGTCN